VSFYSIYILETAKNQLENRNILLKIPWGQAHSRAGTVGETLILPPSEYMH